MSQSRKLRRAAKGKAPTFSLPNAEGGERGLLVTLMNQVGKALVEEGVPPDACLRSLMLTALHLSGECNLDFDATATWAKETLEQELGVPN